MPAKVAAACVQVGLHPIHWYTDIIKQPNLGVTLQLALNLALT